MSGRPSGEEGAMDAQTVIAVCGLLNVIIGIIALVLR